MVNENFGALRQAGARMYGWTGTADSTRTYTLDLQLSSSIVYSSDGNARWYGFTVRLWKFLSLVFGFGFGFELVTRV